MDDQILFYMQKEGEARIDLEHYDPFKGLRYSKCTGLLDKGKRKNVYTESYSDNDSLRVWQGSEVTREATDITFKFFFLGDTMKESFENFYNYVKNGKITYYDTKRKKKAVLILIDAIKVSDDRWKDGTTYIEGDFKFKNIKGECLDVDDDGNELN